MPAEHRLLPVSPSETPDCRRKSDLPPTGAPLLLQPVGSPVRTALSLTPGSAVSPARWSSSTTLRTTPARGGNPYSASAAGVVRSDSPTSLAHASGPSASNLNLRRQSRGVVGALSPLLVSSSMRAVSPSPDLGASSGSPATGQPGPPGSGDASLVELLRAAASVLESRLAASRRSTDDCPTMSREERAALRVLTDYGRCRGESPTSVTSSPAAAPLQDNPAGRLRPLRLLSGIPQADASTGSSPVSTAQLPVPVVPPQAVPFPTAFGASSSGGSGRAGAGRDSLADTAVPVLSLQPASARGPPALGSAGVLPPIADASEASGPLGNLRALLAHGPHASAPVASALTFALQCGAGAEEVEVLAELASHAQAAMGAASVVVWASGHGCLLPHDGGAAVPLESPPGALDGAALRRCHSTREALVDAGDAGLSSLAACGPLRLGLVRRMLLPLTAAGASVGVLDIVAPVSDECVTTVLPRLRLVTITAAVFLQTRAAFARLTETTATAAAVRGHAARLLAVHADPATAASERGFVKDLMAAARGLVAAERCSVFLVHQGHLDAFHDEDGPAVRLPRSDNIPAHVTATGACVNLPDAHADERFDSDTDRATGCRTQALLCAPIALDGSVAAVVQLVNKQPLQGAARAFSTTDVETLTALGPFAAVAYRALTARIESGRQQAQAAAVSRLIALLAAVDIADVRAVASVVTDGAKELTGASAAAVLAVDRERGALCSVGTDSVVTMPTSALEPFFPSQPPTPMGSGPPPKTVRLEDPSGDDRWAEAGVETAALLGLASPRSVMLCPLVNARRSHVATLVVADRQAPGDGADAEPQPFTAEDAAAVEEFAAAAGMALHNAQLLEFSVGAAEEAQAVLTADTNAVDPFVSVRSRDTLSTSMIRESSSALQPPPTPSTRMRRLTMPADPRLVSAATASRYDLEADPLGVRTIDFDLPALQATPDRGNTVASFLRDTSGLATKAATEQAVAVVAALLLRYGAPFGLSSKAAVHFAAACCNNYRQVPYHNFFHAVDVTQTMETLLGACGAAELLTPLDCFTLLFTALVHDIDHMGLNNHFHMLSDSPMGILSATTGQHSVLEVHHCNVAITLLAKEECDLFGSGSGFTAEDRRVAISNMVQVVLASDMARHHEVIDRLRCIVEPEAPVPMGLSTMGLSNMGTQPASTPSGASMAVSNSFYEFEPVGRSFNSESFAIGRSFAHHGGSRRRSVAQHKERRGTGYDKDDSEHRLALMLVLLKAADISNSTKPMHISRVWARRVTEEFHNLGDRHRERGLEVPPMLDRGAGIAVADGQVAFITNVIEPLFEFLTGVVPGAQPLLDRARRNRECWALEGSQHLPGAEAPAMASPPSVAEEESWTINSAPAPPVLSIVAASSACAATLGDS